MNTRSPSADSHALRRPAGVRWPRCDNHARRDFAIALVALLLVMAWEISGLDLQLTRMYGSRDGFVWRDLWLTRAVLHDGGRAIAWGLFGLLLADAARPLARGPARGERVFWVGVTVLCLLLVPTLKRLADSSCPWDLAEFGGLAPYVPHWRLGVRDGGPGHCFPSGHAVAAFAYLSVYFGWRDTRPRLARVWLALACIAGALFGWAQLARGAHFASHTLWSGWLCWVVCAMAAHMRSVRRTAARRLSA